MNNKSLMNIFEESGKEVYQVSKNEWVSIMRDHHINTCCRPVNEFINHTLKEVELFHQQEVENALKNNIELPTIVLADYPSIIEKVEQVKAREQAKKEAEELAPKLTQDIFNMLNIGDKITIGNTKVTVNKKENNELICKLYRSRTKGVALSIGDKANISIGW
jgi:hypothetical protein